LGPYVDMRNKGGPYRVEIKRLGESEVEISHNWTRDRRVGTLQCKGKKLRTGELDPRKEEPTCEV